MKQSFFATERGKLRQMNFTEKRQYIWEYYKLHIIAFVLSAAFIIYIVNTIMLNPPPRPALYFAWMEVRVMPGQLQALSEALTEMLVEDPVRYEVRVSDYTLTGNAAMDMALQTRFAVYVQSREIDAVITTSEGIYESDYLGFLRCAQEFAFIIPHERLYNFNGIYAVSMRGSWLLEQYGFEDAQDIYLAMFINGARPEATAEALAVFFDKPVLLP